LAETKKGWHKEINTNLEESFKTGAELKLQPTKTLKMAATG